MEVKDKEKYKELVDANATTSFIIKFIETWAELMEQQIAHEDADVSDIAYKLSFPAAEAVGDVTGAQVSYAAQMLDTHWLYGGDIYASIFNNTQM